MYFFIFLCVTVRRLHVTETKTQRIYTPVAKPLFFG